MTDGIALRVDTGGLGAPDTKRAGNLKDAAGKFEALLIGQMLKSARQSDSGGWSREEDQSSSSIMDMAEQQLAELLGSNGALGIARMVVSQVGRKE